MSEPREIENKLESLILRVGEKVDHNLHVLHFVLHYLLYRSTRPDSMNVFVVVIIVVIFTGNLYKFQLCFAPRFKYHLRHLI